MTDISDFMFERPVPQPPVKIVRDPTMEAFGEETARVPGTPTSRTRRTGLRLEVAQTPCRAGQCRHPPGTQCGNVVWEPDPVLDEVDVGWTAQHIPLACAPVPFRCILCWSLTDNLAAHECEVAGVLQWAVAG